jgi:hypothetical protein
MLFFVGNPGVVLFFIKLSSVNFDVIPTETQKLVFCTYWVMVIVGGG